MMDGSNFGGPPDDDPTASPRASLRWETVQHLYSINTNRAPPNNLLLVGEIGLELADPVKIWAGVPIDMDPTGRKLIYDSTGVSASLPEAPTDGFIYGREGSNKSWQAVLPLYGGTLTGPLTIQSLTDATLHLEATGQSWAALTFNTPRNDTVSGYIEARRYGYPRWSIELGNRDTELGNNSGSNFVINRYNDTPGNLIFPTAFKIDRNFGYAHFGSLVFLAVDPNTDLEAATKHYVDINSGKGVYLPLLGGTINPGPLNIESDYQTPALNLSGIAGIGVYTPIITMDVEGRGASTGIIQTKRSGFLRWQMTLGDGFTDETGFSVGTDFILSRFDDIGGLLSNVLTIERGTGDTVLAANINIEGYVTLSAGDPQHALEAATKNYVDTQIAKGQYLPLTGGNLTGPLSINPTGFNYPPQAGDQPLLTLVWTVGTGSTNVGEFIVSAGGGEPSLTGVAAQGSMSSPVQVAFQQTLLRLSGRGHDGTAWSSDAASIMLKAAEQWTTQSHSTYLVFNVTRKGRIVPSGSQSMVLASSGNLLLGTSDPAFDDITHRLQVTGAATFTGSVDLQYYPTGATQAASKEYVDDQVKVVTGYLPLTGGQLSGGLSFGQATAPNQNPGDLTRHISLFDGWGGFSVTTNSLNIVYSGETWFYYLPTGAGIARFTNVGLWFNPTYTIVLGRDPAFPYEAATMQWVTAQVSSGAFLPLVGGTLTGNLAIDTTASLQPANLYLKGAPGYGALAAFFYGNFQRWSLGIDRYPENHPTDAGSNFAIYSFHDDGSFNDAQFQILRADGYVVVKNTIQVGRIPSQPMEVATMGYVTDQITAVQGAYLPLTAGVGYPLTDALYIDSTSTGKAAAIHLTTPGWPAVVWNTTTNSVTGGNTAAGYFASQRQGKNRWSVEFGGTEQETGGDQGTNFLINRFHDNGAVNYPSPFAINRQLGTVTIATSLMLAGDPTTGLQAATMDYVNKQITNGAFLPLAGGIMQGGIQWADAWGISPSDATKHLILHSGFGIGIYGPISPRMNFIAGATGTHAFISGQDILYINSAGLTMASNTVDVILTRVPTNNMGAVPRSYADLMLPLAGGTMQGGIAFLSDAAHVVTPGDLTKHINLFGGAYGFSISSGRLNIVTGYQTFFTSTGTGQDWAYFDINGQLNFLGLRTVNLGRDPSDKMDAVTKQYADGLIGAAGGPFLPISAGVGNALQGRLYLTANVLPLDDWEAPPKKYVDTADQNLQSQISAVVSGNLVFYGQLDVAHDVVHYKYTVNLPDTPMPLPTAVPKGGYIIVTVGGIPPTGTGTNIPPLPLGTPQYVRGDWFISDGEIWVFLPTGLVYFTADAVIVSPPIQGTINVQATLQWLSDNKLNLAGGTMQGPLYLATQPTTGSAAVRRDYLTTQLGGYLPLVGGQMSGGITFGTNAGLTPPDTSKHLTLWEQSPGAGGYGIGVSSYRLNYMTPDVLSYHVTMVAGVDIVRVDNTGLRMQGATDIYIPRLPTSGSHAANRDYVDSRTPLAVDAPNDTWSYGRHAAAWSLVPGITRIGAGAFDLNSIPSDYIGMYQITNQTNGLNWPSDIWVQCALVLTGFNSTPGWNSQILMAAPPNTSDAAIWFRNEYGGTWSPWWRMMTALGGTFTGSVTFNDSITLWPTATHRVPLVIVGGSAQTTPAATWGGALAFAQSGFHELSFINLYGAAPRSFEWFQMNSAQTALMELAWFSPNGDFSVNGQVYLLGGAQSSPTQAASVKYVDDFLTRNHGPWLPLAAGAGYPLSGQLIAQGGIWVQGGSITNGWAGAGGAEIDVQANPGAYRKFTWISNTHTIWEIGNAGAEPVDGTNAGGDLAFYRYSDTGVYLGRAMMLSRATGEIILEHNPTTALGAATMQYVDAVRTLVTGSYLPLIGGVLTGQLQLNNAPLLAYYNTQAVPSLSTGFYLTWNFSGGSGEVNFWNLGGGGNPGFNFRRPVSSGVSFSMATLDSAGNLTTAGWINIGAGQPQFGYQAANKDYVDTVKTSLNNYLLLAGGTMQGGISFGAQTVPTQADLSRHILLYNGGATNQFGFGVSFAGTGKAHLNYVVQTNADHVFMVNNQFIAWIDNGGVTIGQGYLTLANDPTSNMHAVTLQYLNSQIAAGVRSFNTRTGFVTLTSLDVTNALTYTPVNRAGDTMTGALFVSSLPTTTTAQLDIGPPFGVGNSLEGKLRFRGTFGGTIGDIGPRFTASLRSGYAGASAWGGEYLDVWMANGVPNDANSDINQVQVLRWTKDGIHMPANMHIYLAADPSTSYEAATMQYADGVLTRAGGPFLPISGGTLQGLVTTNNIFNFAANSSQVTGINWGLVITNNLNQGQGEVDFVCCWQNFGGFAWWQLQPGYVKTCLMQLEPSGILDLWSIGIKYQGLTHGGNVMGFAWYNNTVETYVDGNFIGGLLTTAGGTLTGDLYIANNHSLGLIDAGGGKVYFIVGADNHFGFYSTAQNGASSVAVWDFYVRTDVSYQHFWLPTEFVSNVTMDGQLYVKGANPQLNIQGPAGTWRTIQFYSGALNRWNIQLDPNAESGGNVGSDLRFTSWSDAGGVLGVPLMISRGTGKVTISSIASNDPLALVVPNGNWARIFSTVSGTGSWAFGTRNDGMFAISDENAQLFRLIIDTVGTASFGASVNISNAGGLHFGNKIAPNNNPADTSQHITLWDGGYGFCITGGTLNYSTGGAHDFYSGGISLRITGAGVWTFVPLTLAADPTANMHAATKQYVDNNFTAITSGGIHPTWLHVSGSTAAYTPQGGYVMWNRAPVYAGIMNFVNNRGLGSGGFSFTDSNGTTDSLLLTLTQGQALFNNTNLTLDLPSTNAGALSRRAAGVDQWVIWLGSSGTGGLGTNEFSITKFVGGAAYSRALAIDYNTLEVTLSKDSQATTYTGGPLTVGTTGQHGVLKVQSTAYPRMQLYQGNGAADQKFIDMSCDPDGSLLLQFVNDAFTLGNGLLRFQRGAGYAAGTATFYTPAIVLQHTVGPTIQLNKQNTGAVANSYGGQTNGTQRWLVQVGNGEAESPGAGTNVGSNFAIYRYADDGTYLGNPLIITRSNGFATFAQNLYCSAFFNCSNSISAGADVSSMSGSINASTSLGAFRMFIYNANLTRYLRFRDDGYDLIWSNSTGSWDFMVAGTGSVWTLTNGGNNTIKGNFSAAGSITGNPITSLGVMWCNGGALYWANNPNYYFSYNFGNGNYDFVANAVLLASMRANRDFYCANSIYAQGGVFAANDGQFGFFVNGTNRQFSFASSWFLNWNTQNGDLNWWNAAYANWQWIIRNDRWCYNTMYVVGGVGPYQDLSDERGKTDIAPSIAGLPEVMRLNPIRFRRIRKVKAKQVIDDWHDVGFSAQEVREVIPEAVMVAGFELPDGSGGIDSDNPTLSLGTTAIIAALVNAVKELKAEVDELKATRTLH